MFEARDILDREAVGETGCGVRAPCKESTMTATSDISVGIKTFMRTPKLRLCLESLTRCPWREVIIADDGPIDEEREQLYRWATGQLPLKLLRLPFDTGLSAGRNEIVRHCGTDYLLMLDDDQTVGDDIGRLADVLDENERIGGVSCIWLERDGLKCTACDIELDGPRVIKRISSEKPERVTTRGWRYVVFEFIPNSTLFRTTCLRELPWDPFYKIGKEHLDFYLAHKKLGKWLFAVCLDVQIGHHPEGSSSGKYGQFRGGNRLKVSEEYFFRKFGVSEVVEGRKYIESASTEPASKGLKAKLGSMLDSMLGRGRGG
jgi:glycosyltransferase involved in cell wall biosynthesis